MTRAALACAVLCAAGGAALSAQPAQAPREPVTFADQVAPILFDRCVSCHHPEGSAPFSLASYDAARSRASLIAAVTARRYMPPWKAEPGYGEFVGHRPLSTREIDLLQRWAAAGAPEGDSRRLAPPAWTSGWQLGTPDLVLELPEAYRLRPEGGDLWRIFVFDVPGDAVRYVRGLEFRPGASRVIHHARIRLDRTTNASELDRKEPGPGYEGLIPRSAVYPDGHFLGWTPGQAGPMLPEGLAWRLEPGSHLVVELHMVPSGKPELVDPSIGLFFTANPPVETPALLRLGRQNLDIAPGQRDYVSADRFVLPVDVELLALQPHAHYRAREVRATATLPDGSRRWLLWIKEWDVRWQHVYQLVTPMALARGTTLAVEMTFDNSAENPRNPTVPPTRVQWGEEALSEMGELWIQLRARDPRELRTLNAAIEPKMTAEDVVGYEMRLRADPSRIQLHDQAAEAYLYLGRAADAVRHFEMSLKARPESPAAYYNLGTALAESGRSEEALERFRRALELNPRYAAAHNNIANVLVRLGRPDEAITALLEALRIEPDNADAHFNAGVLRRGRGEVAEPIAHFRRAVALRPDWAPALSNLAWLLATSSGQGRPEAEEAMRLAERAAALTPRADAGLLDVLAATYAASGQFQRAIETIESALALAPREPLAGALRQRLALYRSGTKYVSPNRPPPPI